MVGKNESIAIITGLIALVILVKGWPFGNPVEFAEIWIYLWRGIFTISLVGIGYKALKAFVLWVIE